MLKKVVISTVLASVLVLGFSGCGGATAGPSVKEAQGDIYLEYKNNRPSKEAVCFNIPIKEVQELNKKLELLSKAYKSSILLTEIVFQNEEVEKLMTANAKKIEALEEKIKNKTQAEQEKELLAMLNELEATQEFKKAKKNVATKGEEIKKEIKKMALEEVKNYLLKQFNAKSIMSNSAIASMNFMEKGKITWELKKVPTAISQVTYTIKGTSLVTARKTTDVVYAGQDATMFLKNSLSKSLSKDIPEDEALGA